MPTLDQLIGRLMNLENKYYELQSKYQTLIHQYEELKAERNKEWKGLSIEECQDLEFFYGPPLHPEFDEGGLECLELLRHAEYKLKEKNENCIGHRDIDGSSDDSSVRN